MFFDENEKVSLPFLQAIIDALPFHIALLDDEGFIRLVNEAWCQFGRENGLNSNQIGVNYLEVTRVAAPFDKQASRVLELLQQALSGESVKAFVEYPCHSPTEKRYFRVYVNTIFFEGKRWVLIVHENVTAEILSQEKEQQSYRQFQALFTHMQEGVVLHQWIRDEKGSIVDYRIVAANESFSRHTGLDVKQSIGMPATQLYGLTPPPYIEEYKRVYETQKPEIFETYYSPMDRYFGISAIPWEDGFATIFMDVTTLQKQKQMLENLLVKKEFLYRELQHRAKNTFSLIAGLIGLTALDYTGEVQEILWKLRQQVIAMAKVYEVLYVKEEETSLDLSNYLQIVVDGFCETFENIFRNVKKEISLEPLRVSAREANLIGLWLTEVLNNATKYAFGNRRVGWLFLSLKKSDNKVEIVYRSGGREPGESVFTLVKAESTHFGSQVMQMVVEELKGTQSISYEDGIQIVFTFPYKEESK